MLSRLLDGFDGKLTVTKWVKITECSGDTAILDIKELIGKSILCKTDEVGGSTN